MTKTVKVSSQPLVTNLSIYLCQAKNINALIPITLQK